MVARRTLKSLEHSQDLGPLGTPGERLFDSLDAVEDVIALIT
jgi:hypothetical protein